MHCFPSWSSPSHNTCRLCHVRVKDKPKINLSPKMTEEKTNWEGKLGRVLFCKVSWVNQFFSRVPCSPSWWGGDVSYLVTFPSTWHHCPVLENGGRIGREWRSVWPLRKDLPAKGAMRALFLLIWSTFFAIFSTSHSGRKEWFCNWSWYVRTSLSSEPPIFKNLFY